MRRPFTLFDQYLAESGQSHQGAIDGSLAAATNPGLASGYEKWLREREEREQAVLEAENQAAAARVRQRQAEVKEEVRDRRVIDSSVARISQLTRGAPTAPVRLAPVRGGAPLSETRMAEIRQQAPGNTRPD